MLFLGDTLGRETGHRNGGLHDALDFLDGEETGGTLGLLDLLPLVEEDDDWFLGELDVAFPATDLLVVGVESHPVLGHVLPLFQTRPEGRFSHQLIYSIELAAVDDIWI